MKYYQNRWPSKSRKDARKWACLVSVETRLHHLWVPVTCGPHHPWAPTTCGCMSNWLTVSALMAEIRFGSAFLPVVFPLWVSLPSLLDDYPSNWNKDLSIFFLKLVCFLKLNFWLLCKGFLCDTSYIYHYTLFLFTSSLPCSVPLLPFLLASQVMSPLLSWHYFLLSPSL